MYDVDTNTLALNEFDRSSEEDANVEVRAGGSDTADSETAGVTTERDGT